MKQPNLEVRVKNIIEFDGLKFKDLNNNWKLDPYGDWRLSPRERAENLVSLKSRIKFKNLIYVKNKYCDMNTIIFSGQNIKKLK